jgi:predicted DNA-binding transcriptional regulator YafY
MSVSRIYRLLRLITMLQSGQSFTVEQLSAELEVSRRTVFRDLNVLEMARIGEIAWWILGYGDQVKVVAPAELAAKVAGVAGRTAAQYAAGGQ